LEKRKIYWINLALAMVLSFLVLVPTLWFGIGADQGLHAYGAWVWRKFSLPPYIGCFDHNFPGIFILHYFIQSVFGESVTALRVFDLLWQMASAYFAFQIAMKIFRAHFAGFFAAVLYAFAYLNLAQWDSAQRDGFLPLLYFASFWLFMRKSPYTYSALVSGLLLGFGFTLKPVAALPALVLLAFIIQNGKARLLAELIFCLAFAAPAAAIIAYYWHLGALKELYQAAIYFNSKIYAGSLFLNWKGVLRGLLLTHLLHQNLAVLAGALFSPLWIRRLPAETKIYAEWLMLILLCAYIGYVTQGKYYTYQQEPVWACLCLFAGGSWGLILEYMLEKSPHEAAIKSFAFVIALLFLNAAFLDPGSKHILSHVFRDTTGEGQAEFPYYGICQRCAEYLQYHSAENDRVQIWGGEALINYLAKRKAPSRFPSTLALAFRPGPGLRDPLQLEFGGELLENARKEPPLYFLVGNLPHMAYGISSDKEILVNEYPEIWKFISDNYSLETKIYFVEFYRRNK
jgi:hypothetical protein